MQLGMPQSWTAMWEALSWRFPRPYQPQPSAGDSSDDEGAHRKIAASNVDLQAAPLVAEPSSQRPNRDRSALMNVVTGINAPRAERQRARRINDRDTCVNTMPVFRTTVQPGELVFVTLPDFEG
eukprot:4621005-Pleurochrysis_carterae.AAC.1